MDKIKTLTSTLILILLLSLFMIGCQKKQTYTYLMQHPHELKQAMENCQSSADNDEYCKTVERAVEDFNSLISDQQSNPEIFGQRILDQEIACSKIKQDKNANADQTAATCDEVGKLLAVVSLSSPE